jgi:predicted dithiol-disulfide oxidoreductase (DUF899 family)
MMIGLESGRVRPALLGSAVMSVTFPGESAAYRAARDQLLQKELELRRAMEAVAEARRALPAGGRPPEDYVFDGEDGPVRLEELFGDVHSTLAIYSFMFPRWPTDETPGPTTGATALLPLAEGPCPSCTALLDQLDGAAPHFSQRAAFAVAARAPSERLSAFKAERGWRHLRMISCGRNSYSRDYHGEVAEGPIPMLNVFRRGPDGVSHFWASELYFAASDPGQAPRHLGTIEPLWNLFDLTPEGRAGDYEERIDYPCHGHPG